MRNAPIILVPGFWLGGWAWDEVARLLREDGFDVTALTLPGMESKDADRSKVGFADHVDAIIKAIEAKDEPVVLAVHSATGFTGYAASDRVPERIAAMVYVDSAPGIPPQDPDFADAEKPLVWAELSEEENLDGVSDEQQATFQERGVPVPGGVLRDGYPLTNDARNDIPSTLICTAFTAEDYQKYAADEPVMSWLAGVRQLRNATWIDMPTSHWPMFSKPRELADHIAEVARIASNPVTA
jgi:pimeloyl-ACP methyl ester carboxylesterase